MEQERRPRIVFNNIDTHPEQLAPATMVQGRISRILCRMGFKRLILRAVLRQVSAIAIRSWLPRRARFGQLGATPPFYLARTAHFQLTATACGSRAEISCRNFTSNPAK